MPPKTLTVYDPAMCCSTGVCGPDLDPALVRFSADLEWLAARGVVVRRYNLAQEPGAFAEDAAVRALLESKGSEGLPLIDVDGEVVSTGTYPTREELAAWANAQTETRAPTPDQQPSTCCGPTVAAPSAEKKSSCC